MSGPDKSKYLSLLLPSGTQRPDQKEKLSKDELNVDYPEGIGLIWVISYENKQCMGRFIDINGVYVR